MSDVEGHFGLGFQATLSALEISMVLHTSLGSVNLSISNLPRSFATKESPLTQPGLVSSQELPMDSYG